MVNTSRANSIIRMMNTKFRGGSPALPVSHGVRYRYSPLPKYNSPARRKANSLRRRSLAPPKRPGLFRRVLKKLFRRR